ncbi:MAG TPA: DUF1854 domain-containing protein [Clostridiales bacterium]|nr:DUF1854 domain-containing protein [Clostridiales bacterium]
MMELTKKEVLQENNEKEIDESLQEYTQLKFIDPNKAVFSKTPGGFLSLHYNDKEYKRINVHRTFPFTRPNKYISVSDADKNEIGFILDMDELSRDHREIIDEELSVRYFTPEILKVNQIKEEFGYYYWDVETSSGSRKFTVQGGHSNMKTIDEIHLLIIDVDGNRYKVEDVTKIDSKYLKLIGALI